MNKQTVVITGASRGLGLALAEAYAQRGAKLVLVARNEEALLREVRSLRERGADVVGLAFDVSAKEDAYRLAGAAQALVGPIDVLVHNASTLGDLPLRPLELGECETFSSVLETNLVGPYRLTKAIMPSLKRPDANRPAVVFISSDAAVAAYPEWGFYGVSKAALDHLARTWAVEEPAVKFICVDPGEMDTQMHRDAVPNADRTTLRDPRAVASSIVSRIDESLSGSRFVAGAANE